MPRRPSVLAATGLTGLAVAATVTATVTGVTGASAVQRADGKAMNIIYLLGDGMGTTHVDAARIRYYGAHGQLNMERLPARGNVRTWAVEKGSSKPAYVPDSAAAGTAWSSGVKTYNAAIGVNTYEKVVPTLMEQAHRVGMRTGNVSTAEITDATPAAMMSHALLRGCQGPDYDQASCVPQNDDGTFETPPNRLVVTPIAEQIARNNTADVIFGGGLARFEPDDQKVMESHGYTVLGSFGDASKPVQDATTQQVATRTDLANVHAKKVIGLFNRGNLTVEYSKARLPQTAPEKKEPSLAQLTRKSISLLEANSGKKGFFLQVEGALIDKRSHANDAAQTLGETKAFDDAVKAATDFAKRDGHTLVIVTADHECAGFNIIERGTYTNAEAAAPPVNVDSGNPANNSTPTRPGSGALDPARSSGIINGAGSTDPKNFGPATFATADDPKGTKDGTPEASLWLSYLSGNHTGQDVPLFAYGPGSARFDSTVDNTQLYDYMHDLAKALN